MVQSVKRPVKCMFGNVENSVFSACEKIIIFFSNNDKNNKLVLLCSLACYYRNVERYSFDFKVHCNGVGVLRLHWLGPTA